MNYYKKFGFVVTSSKTSYESDEDSEDEEDVHLYYHMELDLSRVSGLKETQEEGKEKIQEEN